MNWQIFEFWQFFEPNLINIIGMSIWVCLGGLTLYLLVKKINKNHANNPSGDKGNPKGYITRFISSCKFNNNGTNNGNQAKCCDNTPLDTLTPFTFHKPIIRGSKDVSNQKRT